MISITYRITGLMFLLITITVFLLTYLANWQMTNLFQGYLGSLGHAGGHLMGHMGMGLPEQEFLASVHEALGWVGAVIALVGLAVSFALARSITVPLRKLNAAVQEIAKGNYSQRVEVKSNDEAEQLASGFNLMAEALETNNHLRKQLLADIAHELRTPLAVIQGNLEGMLDGVIETDKEQLSSLLEETLHLNRMISDLRDLSLAEAGQLTLDKGPADINQLVSRCMSMLKPLADEKKIMIEASLGELPLVDIDANRINQVFYNLLTNAIRYTSDTGRVTVTTGAAQGHAVIGICDTGQGIAAADLPHIFDQFYRADKSRTRRSGGSGIGLSIVKRLAEIHGGRVEVISKPGEGSCFTVYLPLNKPG